MRADGLVGKEGRNTSVCSLTLEKDGDLVAGVADMGIVETLTEEFVRPRLRRMLHTKLISNVGYAKN